MQNGFTSCGLATILTKWKRRQMRRQQRRQRQTRDTQTGKMRRMRQREKRQAQMPMVRPPQTGRTWNEDSLQILT